MVILTSNASRNLKTAPKVQYGWKGPVTAQIHRQQILSFLDFPFRASPQGFKTRLLGEGVHTLVKGVLFSSPTNCKLNKNITMEINRVRRKMENMRNYMENMRNNYNLYPLNIILLQIIFGLNDPNNMKFIIQYNLETMKTQNSICTEVVLKSYFILLVGLLIKM